MNPRIKACENCPRGGCFRGVFLDSFVPQAIIDLDGVIVAVNEQFCGLFHSKCEDLVGQSFLKLLVRNFPEEFVPRQLVEEFKRQNFRNWQTERAFHRTDGQDLWAIVNVSTLRNAEGEVTELVIQLQEITERKSLEETLRRSVDEMNQFAYIASHDLREPLMAIAGFASLLKRRAGETLDERNRYFLDQVIEGAKRMEAKIDDLLMFSRAGRTSSYTTFPLEVALNEARRAVCQAIEKTQATIEVVGELPMVIGDRSMIAGVFQNLLSNSMKYRKKDVPPLIQVSSKPSEEAGYHEVIVVDNGIGFDQQYAERIFGVFQRLYTVEEYPGTGIGLAIAKKSVEQYGGSIWARSAPGQGATFHFTVPALPRTT